MAIKSNYSEQDYADIENMTYSEAIKMLDVYMDANCSERGTYDNYMYYKYLKAVKMAQKALQVQDSIMTAMKKG